jgi:uncharacterized protein
MIASLCVPFVLNESYTLNVLQSRIHGLDHWYRVWQNAKMLNGEESLADMEVVALFCLFHDSMRVNDGDDSHHGLRAIKLWERLNEVLPGLNQHYTQQQDELFFEACVEHSNGETSSDPTIAVCWDADRLDLHRVGIWPDPRFMSTEEGVTLTTRRIKA